MAPRAKGTGSIFRPNGSSFYWIAYFSGGKRHYESTKSERKKVAQDLLTSRLGDVQRGVPVTPKVGKLTLGEAAKAVIDDFIANTKRSLKVVKRRLEKHLLPYFGEDRRMVTITAADVVAYKVKRLADAITIRKARKIEHEDGTVEEFPGVTKPTSAAEVNRELQVLKRCFNLAIEQGLLMHKPHIEMLREAPARSGFFEPDQLAAVLRHLPEAIRPVIRFAAITGWRIGSEVLPLEWRQVDFDAGEVRLDAGTTKNREARTFPLTADLRKLLEDQHAQHERLKREGRIVPLVFHRDGERIHRFEKSWRAACVAAGCPGRIPHDLRRTAIRTFVRNGISEHVAMKLSGHKTASVFRRYDIVSDGDLLEAARRLDARPEATRTKTTTLDPGGKRRESR